MDHNTKNSLILEEEEEEEDNDGLLYKMQMEIK
jgi:hypothetical protein